MQDDEKHIKEANIQAAVSILETLFLLLGLDLFISLKKKNLGN